MATKTDVLDLLYPSSKTTLMQHLQNLVLRRNEYWIGGVVPAKKLAGLVLKMSERYPLTRTERGRTYDRSRGLATVHLVVYPTAAGVAWWILSSEGRGGLADPGSPDHHVARHAMRSEQHLHFDDYVLLYAHKKDARTLVDARTGREKRILKNTSTWTWKLTSQAYNEALAVLEAEALDLNYGWEQGNISGVRGVLLFQRRRPLFSGVRAQVLQLHREALEIWGRVRKAWLAKHPHYAQRYGAAAGQLRSINEIAASHLPKMPRFRVFSNAARTVRSLTAL